MHDPLQAIPLHIDYCHRLLQYLWLVCGGKGDVTADSLSSVTPLASIMLLYLSDLHALYTIAMLRMRVRIWCLG